MAAVAQAQTQQRQEGDKELRGNIRGLLNRAKRDHHNLISVDNNAIVKLVEESNEYVDKVTRPRDQAVDAEFFSYVTEAGLEFVNRLKQGGRAFAAGDFLRRLKARYVRDLDAQAAGAEDPEAFNWAQLGQLRHVSLLFRTVPVVHHMLGPLDAQPRQRKQVQRQARRKLPTGPAERPEEVENLVDNNKQETDRNMEEMWRVLTAHNDRVVMLDLVLNHNSFAQTNENLFTLSFLVRDDRVTLEEDEELGLIVQKLAPKGNQPKEKGGAEKDRTQFVMKVDMDVWELWKMVVDPSREPLMKHRKEWRGQAAGAAAAAAAAAAAQQEQEEQQQEQQQQEEQQQEEQEEQEEEDAEAAAAVAAAEARRRQKGKGPRRQQTPEEEEEEQPAPKRRKSLGKKQQQLQEQQEQPVTKRRKSLGVQQEQQAEQEQQAPKRRTARGQQQEQQPSPQKQQQQVAVKPEPGSQPRRRQQQQQQQEEEPEVIVISDSEIIIPDSSSDEPDVVEEAAGPAPKKQQKPQATPSTQQGTQGTQGSGRRMPMRGKR